MKPESLKKGQIYLNKADGIVYEYSTRVMNYFTFIRKGNTVTNNWPYATDYFTEQGVVDYLLPIDSEFEKIMYGVAE